jgi:hypothetical protein
MRRTGHPWRSRLLQQPQITVSLQPPNGNNKCRTAAPQPNGSGLLADGRPQLHDAVPLNLSHPRSAPRQWLRSGGTGQIGPVRTGPAHQRWRFLQDERRGTCAVPRCLAVVVRRAGDSTVSAWLLRRPWPVSGSMAGLLLTSWCAIHDFLWSLAWTLNVRRFTSGTAGQGSWMSSGPLPLTRLPTEMLPAGSGGSGHPLWHGIRTSLCLWWRARAE